MQNIRLTFVIKVILLICGAGGIATMREPFAVVLSRKSKRIINQNLWVTLGVTAFLIPATIFGLNIGPAVLAHEGSTLVVVFNALRLLGYKS